MDGVIEFILGINDGGAETLVKDYVLLLDKKKFSPVVVTLYVKESSANYKTITEAGVPIITIYKHWNLFKRAFNKIFGRVYVPIVMRRLLRTINPRVLHAHMDVLKYMKPMSKSLRDIRLFYTCHSIPERYLGGAKKLEHDAAEYLIRHNGLQMVALHDEMAKEINEMFGIDNTATIRNGIDFSRYENIAETKAEIRNSLHIPADAFVVGHVGRFHPIKNHAFLVKVFRLVAERNEKAFLLLVGAGVDKEKMAAKLKGYGLDNRILILSNRSDVPRLMKAMDVFVFPSIVEGLGIVMIEAQKSGLKCIASDGVPDAAFVTDLAVSLTLDAPLEEWVDVILDTKPRCECSEALKQYDMRKEIKQLEKLYFGEK